MRSLPVSALCAIFLVSVSQAHAEAPRGYYRFPALHGDQVVFSAEGDLWKVQAAGGVAQRLTTHLDEEAHPAFSPDGALLAFTAAYEGTTEVYTMPADGGLPVRRTWGAEGARVIGFTPDGKLIYTTRDLSTLPDAQLVTLDPQSGATRLLPLAQAAEGCYDPASATWYFTRYRRQGSHTKRYKGGTAQNLWRWTEGEAEAIPLTADYAGTSHEPMCGTGRVWFLSDRDGTMNLWSMDMKGGDLRQHTRHDGWDAKDPQLDGGRIVYRVGADLRIYDIRAETDRAIDVRLASDFDQMREVWVDEPFDWLTSAHPSNDGDRVVLTARGQVFVAPVGDGRLVEATRRAGVRYRQARFLPDGKSLVALSDESGEVEWWRLPASGIGSPERITRDGKVLRFDGVVSPDGKWIAHYDQDQELWITRIADGDSFRADFSPLWGFDGPTWSPDSAWIAYGRPADNGLSQLFLYNVAKKERVALTSDRFDSGSAVWSPDGKWIYFLSDREFDSLVGSPWGSRQPQPFFDRQTRIYEIALLPGLRSRFQPDDELKQDDGKDDDEDSDDKKTDEGKGKKARRDGEDVKKTPEVKIETEGLAARIRELPVERDNLSSLAVNDDHLFWIRRDTSGKRQRNLIAMEIKNKDPKPETIVEDVRDYELTGDGKKLLVRREKVLHVIDAKAKKPELDDTEVDLDDWEFALDPREEWRQMFVESWRLERDYFYDRGMHGVDWKAMLDKYRPLVERVTNRAELSDLQGQLASELSALHIFVSGGEHREAEEEIETASLGAQLVRDAQAGGWRVERVYRADPELPRRVAPLARAGVEVMAGDVIESIDGVATLSVPHPGQLLRDRAGRQVRLRVKPAGGKPARDVIVEPIGPSAEADLRYDDWELTRREAVERGSDGRIGYVHLRAMGSRDIGAWYREFFPVFDRQGLIVDVRHNRGGNIDSWVLAQLSRRAWFYWQPRVGAPYWNMQGAFRGHMVVLVDAWTASDGEAFAEGFRRLGLGPVLGMRTWGGEIWLTSSNTLVDRGIVSAAEFGVYGPEGDWLIEGHGVEPDIVVDNLPRATFDGQDAQLEAALDYLEKKIAEDPRPIPPAPKYPIKIAPMPGK